MAMNKSEKEALAEALDERRIALAIGPAALRCLRPKPILSEYAHARTPVRGWKYNAHCALSGGVIVWEIESRWTGHSCIREDGKPESSGTQGSGAPFWPTKRDALIACYFTLAEDCAIRMANILKMIEVQADSVKDALRRYNESGEGELVEEEVEVTELGTPRLGDVFEACEAPAKKKRGAK